jgi:hypothetical protein
LAHRLEIRLQGSHSIDELVSLQDYINAEHGLRAAAKLERQATTDGSLGAVVDLVAVALSPGGVAAILAPALITWIRQHRSKVSLCIKKEDGSEVELSADRIKAVDVEQLRKLVAEISEALADGDS